jgi:polysaccharide export outer membrane protein
MSPHFFKGIILIALLMTAPTLRAEDQASTVGTKDYTIGPGDVLDISVWNNEALTKLVTVRPDGKIHFPLIGEIVAGGKTVAFLQKELNEQISPFVPDPNLSLMVQQINSLLIYVIGKVNRPGRLVLNSNINVLQALTMAGGLNAFAKKNHIKIFREKNNKTLIFPFDYDDITNGKNLEQNMVLLRGDVVVVP